MGLRRRNIKLRSTADNTNYRKSNGRHAINYVNLWIPQIVDPPSVHFVMISFRFLAHRPSKLWQILVSIRYSLGTGPGRWS